MLGEFFAARADEFDQFVAEGPFGRRRTVEAKGLTPVSLATLGEILGVGSYDQLVGRIEEGPEAENDEAGVLTIPTAFRNALAGRDDLDATAGRWAATEELALDGWRASDALEVLRDLRELAREAAERGEELWYWWSL